MYINILNNDQAEILPFLKLFNRSFYLVGGTAIAMHLGHRRSIDFDLFTNSKLNKSRIRNHLNSIPFKKVPVFEDYDQMHLLLNNVKITFFTYPYDIKHKLKVGESITIPSLNYLAAMKAFALGRRSKWKDYVDLYFILKDHFSINEISSLANEIYKGLFSEKLFREQLAFHKDIDFSETVEYIVSPVPEEEIKQFLIDKALEW
jgi:hypothetical protein